MIFRKYSTGNIYVDYDHDSGNWRLAQPPRGHPVKVDECLAPFRIWECNCLRCITVRARCLWEMCVWERSEDFCLVGTVKGEGSKQ